MPTKPVHKPEEKSYSLRIPYVDNLSLYMLTPALLAFLVYGTWIIWKSNDLFFNFINLFLVALVIVILYFQFAFRDYRMVITLEGIQLKKRNNTLFLMRWEEMAKVSEIWGSAVLMIKDISGKRKILVRPGVPYFDEIREKLFSEWKPRFVLPETHKAFPYWRLELDKNGLKYKSWFKFKNWSWDAVETIHWGFEYFLFPYQRWSFIEILHRNGEKLRLGGWGGRLPEIFITMRRLKGFRKTKADESPIHITEEKLFRNLWLTFFVGVYWVVVTWVITGKLFSLDKLNSLIWFLIFGLIMSQILFLFFAIKRKSLVIHKSVNRQEVHAVAASILIFLSFAAGLGFAVLSYEGIGQTRLMAVKNEIKKAGYSMEMPAKTDELSADKNAVIDLRKAVEIKSAKSLVCISDSEPDWKAPFYKGMSQFDTLTAIYEDYKAGKWSDTDTALGLRLLADHQESISSIETAYQKQKVDWGTDFSHKPTYEIDVPKLGGFLPMGRLFLIKSFLLSKQGNTNAALRSLKTLLFVGSAAQQSQFMLGEMIDVAIYKMELSKLSQVVDSMDPQLVKKELFPLLNESGLEDGYRKSLQLEMFGLAGWKETYDWGFPFHLFVKLNIADFYQCEFNILSYINQPYSRQEAFIQKGLKTYGEKRWVVGSLKWPIQLYSLHPKILEAMAWCRLTRAAVEARIYHEKTGRWPQNVGELPKNNPDDYTDPFADQGTLQIQPVGKGIRITSLGPIEEPTKDNPQGGRRCLEWVLNK